MGIFDALTDELVKPMKLHSLITSKSNRVFAGTFLKVPG